LKTIGISTFYRDSAAKLVVDERIVGKVQEEKFSRKKHDGELKERKLTR
jgi:predicted NodU family carbamoyl transferase